ncbi:SLC24A2 [Symbiodinium natans]|uniref:SLC24A2 protein n=1 Tax=Symbiodinium natans TaxID=878477 RepID=A0A812HZ38_9DINO|nr:SLC24A2 [Symbiodinium natans]
MKRNLEEAYEQHLEYLLKGSKTRFVQPWDRSQILNPPSILPGLPPYQRWGVGLPSAALGSSAPLPTTPPVPAPAPSIPFAKSKGTPWHAKQTESRSAAIAKWSGIMLSHGEHFGVVEKVAVDASGGEPQQLSSVLLDIFALKASATLHGRAGPILRYLKFCKKEGQPPFPFREDLLYRFVKEYCARQVSHVKALEKIVTGWGDFSGSDRYAAGCFLYATYARARFSDMQNSGAITKDVTNLPDGGVRGFLEASVCRTKTAYTLERKTRYLSMCAPVQGLLDESWAIAWMDIAELYGPGWSEDSPLLPAPMAGEDVATVKLLGTHSMKATGLSWAAKWGASKEIRLILGYLSASRADSDVVYGRDNVAPALRQFDQILEDIAFDKFRPDCTRSGMFTPERPAAPEALPDDVLESTEGSEDEEHPDLEEEEQAVDELVGPWQPEPGLRERLDEAEVFRHRVSRFIHVVSSEEGTMDQCDGSQTWGAFWVMPGLANHPWQEERAWRKGDAEPNVFFLPSAARRMAASYSDSQSVFNARVDASGLTKEDATKIKAAVSSLRQLAFISSFTPGQADESPLMAALKLMLGRDAELGVQASFRALYHESYAVVTSELRQKIEKSEEPASRRLTQPERAERFEKQKKKLVGVSIKGLSEPSEALVDRAVACYENNELRYLSWEICTSREQEVGSDRRRDTRFTVDEHTGRLKVENKDAEQKAVTSSEVHVMQALQRRSLAMDQANLVEYATMQQWSDRLMRARMQEAPAGYVRPTWAQLVAADKKLFSELRDLTRDGVQSSGGARPLDTHLQTVMNSFDVVCLMQPLPSASSRSLDEGKELERPERPGPYGPRKPRNPKGQGKGKGKTKAPGMPAQMVAWGPWGCVSATKKGNPYCYGFQLGTCANEVKNNACQRGLHACAIPKCGQHGHGASACPKRSKAQSEMPLSNLAAISSFLLDRMQFGNRPPVQRMPKCNHCRVTVRSFLVDRMLAGNRPLVGLRSSVAQFPEAVKVFTRLIAEVSPTHQFSSFVILEGSEMGIHRDAQNACLPNLVIPLTRFEGGELAVADPEGHVVSHGGQSFRARLCDLGRGPIAFNAQGLQHAVMPFKGRRLVLIAYCLKNVASLDRASCRALRTLGFRLPAKEPPPRTLPAVVTGFPDLRLSGCSSPSPSGHPASPGPALQEAAASEGPPGPSTAMRDSAALPAVRPQKLMFLELCCGSAGLSAAFRALGFQVLAVDHPGNRHVPLVHCVHLDLRLESSWSYLRRLVQARQVFLIHVAPPCGTASRARDIPIKGQPSPPALRSEAFPAGLPGLSPSWQAKVDSANSIYRRAARFCAWLLEEAPHTHFCVENPARSYMWLLPEFLDLRPRCSVVPYDACMHGGARAKHQELWTSLPELSALARQCDNSHPHRPWGILPSGDFSTADEAEYPEVFCTRYASAASLALGSSHAMPSPSGLSNESARTATHKQPRTSKAVVLIDEYHYQVTVPLPSGQLPALDDKNCLCAALGPVPVGSKVLRVNFEGGVVFPKRPRPDRKLADQVLMAGKKLLLLDRIAKSLDWPDEHLHHDLTHGFRLVGEEKPSGVFPLDPKPAELTVDGLMEQAEVLKPLLWDKIAQSPANPHEQELFDITHAEFSEKGWLDPARSWDELEDYFKGSWVPARRFAVEQRGKLRPIDDLAENGVNSAFAPCDKLTLRAIDEIVWTAAFIMRALICKGSVHVPLSTGEVISGPLHPFWASNTSRARPLVKTVDLKSAYKQLPLHPSDHRLCVVSLRRPSDSRVVGYVSKVLPFGASASVTAFNRVARLLQRILQEAWVMTSNYFDDYPLLELSALAGSCEKTVHNILSLLGFTRAADKEEDFAPSANLLGVTLDLSDPTLKHVRVANREDKCTEMSASIDQVLDKGFLKASEVASLFGRIQFMEGQLLGRLGRLALMELRSLCSSNGELRLGKFECDAFRNLKQRLVSGPPRAIPTAIPRGCACVFTDGACEFEDGHPVCTIGGILYHHQEGSWNTRFFACRMPATLVQKWSNAGKRHLIGPVELFAVVVARRLWGSYLDSSRALFFVDHSGVHAACVSGTSRDTVWRSLLVEFERADAVPMIGWIARAEQPLLAEAPALAENLDTTSESSRESLGLQHYSPRTRAEILGRSPPATPSDSEHESEQPDSEPEDDDDDVYPGGHGPAYQNQAELVALYEMVGEAAAIDVMPAMQLIPAGQPAEVQQPLLQDDDILQVREDAEVWIAPVSGTRFHLIGECDGLMRARYVRRLLYRQLQLEFPGQYSMCQLCQFWARELGRRQDIARLAAMFHILHVGGQQIPNPVPQNLPEPEPHDDT